MTENINDPSQQIAGGQEIPVHPTNVLMNLVVALLAPMFRGVTAGDMNLARIAANETMSVYRAQNPADVMAVAQIIGFGLAALGSLSLSSADDISLAMKLRLRGNANALNRSAEQNRRVLRDDRGGHQRSGHAATMADAIDSAAEYTATQDPTTQDKTTQYTAAEYTVAEDPAPESPMLLDPAAAQILAAEAQARLREPHQTVGTTQSASSDTISTTAAHAAEKRHQEMWAIAMVKEAGEINASIPNLPLAERQTATLRAAALGSTAHALLSAASTPPPDRASISSSRV